MKSYDVIVIGGGPAGLAAAESACKAGAKVAVLEREARLGGILKQCVHDGFGLIRFGEKLAGPEYAERYIDLVKALPVDCYTLTFVTRIEKKDGGFAVTCVSREGMLDFTAKALVLATGCRERTAKQVLIQGTRPAGVFTAGTAQNFVNLMGKMPTKKCVILGSGDIGLIMARRLTLEGAEVEGVYEVKPEPSGLTRNIHQCLHDFDIPLHLSHTVTRAGQKIELSAKEFAVLDCLVRNKGAVLSRETIENSVWNYDWEGGTNVVDVYMSYLRRKIDAGYDRKLIHTVRGVGWVLREDA